MTASPRLLHQIVVGNLYLLLEPCCRARSLGRVFLAPVDVVLSPFDVLVPDLVFVAAGRPGGAEEANLTAAPDLAIEVLSRSTAGRDRGAKRRIYERFGVREYWLVDAARRTVDRVVFGATRGGEMTRLGAGDRLRSELFPGLEVTVEEIFRE